MFQHRDILLLDGVLLLEHGVLLLEHIVLLLEHSGVDQLMPLLTIYSVMPSRVDADVERLNIFGNSSQPSFPEMSSWLGHVCPVGGLLIAATRTLW